MVASAADLPMPLPSLDGEPMAPPASLVAQVDALPSFGPVPLPGHRPGEGGILLAAAAPMPVQIPAALPQPAAAPAQPVVAPVQVAAVEVRAAPVVAPVSAAPVARVAAADVPIRPVVAPRRPTAPLEAVAQALSPTRAAASDDPIGALLSGLEAPRGIR